MVMNTRPPATSLTLNAAVVVKKDKKAFFCRVVKL